MIGKTYFTSNNELYYYIAKKRTVYKIPEEARVKFNAFYQRLVISLALAAIIYTFFPKSPLFALVVGGVFYCMSSFIFYRMILPPLKLHDNVDLNAIMLESIQSTHRKTPEWFSSAMLLAGVLIMVGAYFMTDQPLERIVVIVFGALVAIGGTQIIVQTIKK